VTDFRPCDSLGRGSGRRCAVRRRLAALDMVQHWAERPCAITLGADRGYEAADFVENCEA
jgi:hypothetical protein